jgi:hypothetical protein
MIDCFFFASKGNEERPYLLSEAKRKRGLGDDAFCFVSSVQTRSGSKRGKEIEMLEIGLSDIATLPKSSSARALNRRRSFRAKANGITRKVGRKLKSDSPSEDEARSNPATNQ